MDDVYVIGVGMTPFGKLLNHSVRELTSQALKAALKDAGLETKDIQAAFFANAGQSALEGQHMIAGQLALRSAGIQSIPVVNVENACASAGTAFHLAHSYIRSGAADLVLAIGAEKMVMPDKNSSFAVFHGAWDIGGVDTVLENLKVIAGNFNGDHDYDETTRSVFMDVYAALAKQHMRLFGTTERQLAIVSSKNHWHSTFNPLAQYQSAITVEEVLGAKRVAWPLTVPMCSPISDGAAAAILCRRSVLDQVGSRAIRVRASVLASGGDRGADEYDKHICHRAANQAYEFASVGPREMSVAEVHDASAVGEIIQSENLGLCDFGEGGRLAERGETQLGGRIPINPSGGLESKGHPIGATGLGQIWELVTQLRGEAGKRQVAGARFAIAENGGGFHGFEEASACVTILSRD
jgi:acetyl-CoA acyltransferase